MISNLPACLDDFISLCEDCEAIQKEVLKDIVKNAKNTEIGKKFDFKTINDVDMFRHHVAVTTWHDIAPLAKRLEEGESDLLFADKPSFFICTSGTTGKIKIIPESQDGKRLKALTGQLRIEAISRFLPSMMKGKLLPLVNHAIEGYTEAGIPYGSASGITLITASQEVQKKVAFPMELLEIDYSKSMDYFLMRFAVTEDVRAIFGNNAGRIAQLIETAQKEADNIINDIEKGTLFGMETLPESIQTKLKKLMHPNPKLASSLRKAKQEKGHFLPDIYWPNLQVVVCWLSGSVGRYVKTLTPFLSKDILFFDVGYGATEGKFNIPLEPNNAAGVLSIYSAFYEFQESGSDDFLMAHELQNNKSYELYVTTYSGLYRYRMDDIIRVDGFVGTTPKIVFENKAGEILNISGEKVAASSLIPIVNQAVLEITKQTPYHWCVVADDEKKCYHFCIELPLETIYSKESAVQIANRLENLLKTKTFIYPIFREQKLINKLRLTLMKNGWQEALYAEHLKNGRSNAQIKLPLIYADIPKKEFIL